LRLYLGLYWVNQDCGRSAWDYTLVCIG